MDQNELITQATALVNSASYAAGRAEDDQAKQKLEELRELLEAADADEVEKEAGTTEP